ncbi:MAG: di-trans,poly-cis-decaprenylcistransferase [Oscillospiraceae bacterium]|jgi:undecaprenyl diphosphate synthase|nr:di-trans,poly-cis-decaprenylcistransferase [Oscillospiraceae bacterium]
MPGLFKPSRLRSRAGRALPDNLPMHIAVIMDGNGRWAKLRGLPRSAGHKAGAENFRRIAAFCKDIGIKYLTAYVFSTENWKRPQDEIDKIFSLLCDYLDESLATMEQDKVRMQFFGDIAALPQPCRQRIERVREQSARFTDATVNLCVNYGARAEIARAAERLRGGSEPITEEAFSAELYTAGIPDPQLCIRPSGVMRMSNFLLWQTAYSELYFTPTLWPDFSKNELLAILRDYSKRPRRYGGI